MWICINNQNFRYSICSFSETVNFRVMSPDWPHPVLTLPSTKIFKHILICMNLYKHEKNHLIPSVHSSDRVNFGVHRSNWPHPFLTMPNQKICVNLHQHEKNEAVSWICSGKIVDLKILQSDWLRAFWPIFQEQDFFQYRIYAGTQ